MLDATYYLHKQALSCLLAFVILMPANEGARYEHKSIVSEKRRQWMYTPPPPLCLLCLVAEYFTQGFKAKRAEAHDRG